MNRRHQRLPAWRKSSFSDGYGGECVELAAVSDGLLVRDSKNPDGPQLGLTLEAARVLISQLRAEQP
ncbi:DUF397 domain-containing protein [Actinomadura luteofluorescens]|uniref:DUF397 domain-containing protein n=1 Tax=Actinomadura luteofluorescens TaxID=46163 RepID=UPI0015CE239A|nr:DUF397 domain-containing protein [Actinomadura luteofluorescens]